MDFDQDINYQELNADELVELFAFKKFRNEAIRALVGGLTATEFRRIKLSDEVLEALIRGLNQSNPNIRWWCLQLLDHVGDERCIKPISRMLQDPVPRVRKMALHALTCEVCKNSDWCSLDTAVLGSIRELALIDSHPPVREAAQAALLKLNYKRDSDGQ